MQDWQIELAKAFGLAVIGFLGGYGTYWLKSRDRLAELITLRTRQRLEGNSEAARLERAAKATEMMIAHRQHEITPDDFREFYDGILNKRRKKTAPALSAPQPKAIEERGPNGGRIEILPNGDKVEWIHDEAEDEEFSMILLRGEEQIREAELEYFDKVWWNRHQIYRENIEAGTESLPPPDIWARAIEAAKRIEDKYGVENLGWDDFEWGMVNGKLSALRWVLGDEWDFLDT